MSKAARDQKTKGPKVAIATATDQTITLSVDSLVLTATISPEAQWAGIQKASDGSGTGLASVANYNYSTPPGAGHTESIEVQGAGYYRTWSSDFDFDIHLSAFVHVS